MQLLILLVGLFAVVNPASAASADFPKRKSGLWEIKMSNATFKGAQAMQQCIDEKTDDLMKNSMMGSEKQSCSKNEMRREGDKRVAESICKFNDSTAKTRAVLPASSIRRTRLTSRARTNLPFMACGNPRQSSKPGGWERASPGKDPATCQCPVCLTST